MVRAVKADLTGKKPGESIDPADLAPYEKFIDQGAGVLLHTGWDKQFPNSSFFSGFSYVSKALADWFVEKK